MKKTSRVLLSLLILAACVLSIPIHDTGGLLLEQQNSLHLPYCICEKGSF